MTKSVDGVRGKVWSRHGLRRLFLTLDGQDLGWLDLAGGDLRPQPGVPVTVLAAAALKWTEGGQVTLPPFRYRGLPWPDPTPTSKAADLARNRPGAAVQRQVRAQRGGATKAALDWYGDAIDRAEERIWSAGAAGERVVGRALDALVDHGWRVLHAVPVGTRGTDIDHVLIGPGGVYTINTKHHPRRVLELTDAGLLLDGQPVDYLGKAVAEARRATRILADAGAAVPVAPVIVLARGTLRVTRRLPRLTLLHLDDVPGWAAGLPVVLDEATVARLFAVARHRDTWQPSRRRTGR